MADILQEEARVRLHTKRQISKFECCWQIDNFLDCCLELRQQPIQSKSFSFGPGEWQLTHDPKSTFKFDYKLHMEDYIQELYCQHEGAEDADPSCDDSLSFELNFIEKVGNKEEGVKGSDSADKFSIIAKLSIMNVHGNEYVSASQKQEECFATNPLVMNFMLRKINLLSEIMKKEDNVLLTSDGQLSILCQIKIYSSMENEVMFHPTKKEMTTSALQKGVSGLLDSGKHSDVVLVADGGKEFSAHKCILTALSPVFLAMFEHKLSESITNRVEMTEIDGETLAELLRYIYTGQVLTTIDPKVAHRLLMAADKYALDELKAQCGEFLFSRLTSENACESLVLADRYSVEKLKKAAANYIRNNAESIKGSKTGRKYIDEGNAVVLKALAGINF